MIQRPIPPPRAPSSCLRPTFFASCLGLILLCAPPLLAKDAPRYLFFNIAPESAWNQNHPESFSRTQFDEVANTLRAPENPRLRVGVSYIFSTLETPTNILAKSLRRLLAASEESGVPVLVTLDGQNWWQQRPDLWNWWDPNLPDYNPSNVFNVEWTNWSPASAVKICWRNWGTQLRVVPAPNIASPKVVRPIFHLNRERTTAIKLPVSHGEAARALSRAPPEQAGKTRAEQELAPVYELIHACFGVS